VFSRPFEEDRRQAATNVLAAGTLACPHCDAPIGIGPEPLSPGAPLRCPFCAHAGPLREFLSLRPPSRPTRVLVRVTASPRGRRLRVSPAG